MPSALPLTRERRVRDPARDGELLEAPSACCAAAACVGRPGDDDDRRCRPCSGTSRGRVRAPRSAGSLCGESDSSLGFATCSRARAARARRAGRPRARTRAAGAAGPGRSRPARSASRSSRCAGAAGTGSGRGRSAVPSSSSTPGRTVTEPATAQATTAIVAAGEPVEDVRRRSRTSRPSRSRPSCPRRAPCGPTCAIVRSSASCDGSPRWRSSRERIT